MAVRSVAKLLKSGLGHPGLSTMKAQTIQSAESTLGEKLTSAGGKLRAGHGKSFALCAVLRFWLGYIFAHMFGPVLIIKF